MNDPTPQIEHYWIRLVLPMMAVSALGCKLIVQPESTKAPLLLMGAGALGMGAALLLSMAIVTVGSHLYHGSGTKTEKEGNDEDSERHSRP